MTTLRFVQADGREQLVQADDGTPMMHAAVGARVPGILGECGGCCVCATCHAWIDEPWFSALPPAGPTEQATLEGAAARGPRSRLLCRIEVTPALDGLVARIPQEPL